MASPTMESLLPLLTLLLSLLQPSPTIGQPPEFILQTCSNDVGKYTAGSTYRRNLNTLLPSIAADNQTTTGFYNLSSGSPGPDRVNVIGLCRGDISTEECRSCIANATGRILVDCPVQKQALGYYDYCTIRYSNRSIQGSLETNPTYYMWNVNNASDPARLNAELEILLTRLRAMAAGGSSVRKFATVTERQGSFVTIYALLQCSPDLSRRDCDSCLEGAVGQIPNCCSGKISGRAIMPSCNLWFEGETAPFNGDTESPPPPPPPLLPRSPTSSPSPPQSPQGGGTKNTSKIAAIVIPIVGAVAMLGFIFIFFCRRRILRSLGIPNQSKRDAMVEVMSSDGPGKPLVQFDFDTIRAATDNFADARKLGQGGFGAVYKGTLPGIQQDIAVKRLSRHSRQGDMEFKNEGELVAKLQHRNLVRFLGFCLKGNERLLIYEFVPNASLDHFLFDPNKRAHLDWERRYKIISGIARGLVYLHEDSRLRIIHCDLKAGNILLDAEMNPKIADFGLARLFDFDETEGSTRRVVGTYGYMAPEYLIHGNFSIKSDVFSFGVLVLEIVSGQRNRLVRARGSTEEDLLTYAWKSWRNGTYSNLVDPSLRNDDISGAPEITRCIHIGLLCVQKNVNDRPTMTSVAQMLTNYSLSLPLPSQPAFFMHAAGAEGGVVVAASSKSSAGVDDEAVVALSWNEVTMTDICPR